MANITGTNGNDTLKGTAGDDAIQGLDGNDNITASRGNDSIDGGQGSDVVDYSGLKENLNFGVTSSFVDKSGGSQDQLSSIEKVIANPNQKNTITANFAFSIPGDTNESTVVDVDLSKNNVTVTLSSVQRPFPNILSYAIENFQDIVAGGNNRTRLVGNDLNNNITGLPAIGGQSEIVVIGSKGNDTIDYYFTGNSVNTLDYSNLGRSVTILPLGKINKGNFGTDTFKNAGIIIGATNKTNTIDASTDRGSSLDVNLANNLLKVNVLGSASQQIEVLNFVNVIGGANNDTIVGANKNSKLTGGGGNDTITGGNKNDIITGSDSSVRGVGEVDTLTGGGGRDTFVLGDKNGAYYVGKGKDDYATINDFNLFQDSIDLGGFKNYSFASAGNNTIELYSGKDVNNRDLIAKIQLAGGISNRSTNSRSIAGSNSNLDTIISKIDIISGANS